MAPEKVEPGSDEDEFAGKQVNTIFASRGFHSNISGTYKLQMFESIHV